MTVLSLQRQLAQQGRVVSKNTLYRLTSKQPLKKVDLTIAGEICSLFGIGLTDAYTSGTCQRKNNYTKRGA